MTPGRIVVDRVSQRFRVSDAAASARSRTCSSRAAGRETREVWALRDVSLRGRAGRGGRARRPQRLRQDDAAQARLAASSSRPPGRIEVGGRVGSLLELGAGFHPDFTGRENVYLNGSIHGLSRARVRELMDEIVAFAELERFIDLPVRTYSSGMYMRLGFSVAAHIQADVLLLDEVFAVGDEDFQRKCFGKIARVQAARRHDRLRLARRAGRRACSATARCCSGRARSRSTATTREAIARYRRLLADDAQPRRARRRPARVGKRRGAHRLGAAARRRRRRAAAVRGRRAARGRAARRLRRGRRPRRSVSLELRDDDGVALGGVTVSRPPSSAGTRGAGERELRFEVDRLPLADGRFHLRCALSTATAGACCTRSTTRSGSSSSRPARETGRGPARGPLVDAGDRRLRANRTAHELRAPAPTGRS